jgi:cardiolipin synthase A/B
VKLLIQPDNGIKPLIEALRKAKKSIRILIFRFDRVEIEKALADAVGRGVSVQALIAHTNHGEEKNLRRLESRLLAQGISVTRTADDLVRYHGKMLIIDEKTLYIPAFNFTHMDIDLSRSFAVTISKPSTVREAIRLFDCDSKRRPYTDANDDHLIVSPINARKCLTKFIAGTKKTLLIYDMKISDPDFVKLLNGKISDGAVVRVLSRSSAKNENIPVRRLPLRMHLRAMLRDGNTAFLGSQSLRKLELEARREIGIVFRDKKIVKRMEAVFEKDWKSAEPIVEDSKLASALIVPAKKVAKEVLKQIGIKPVVEEVIEKVIDPKDPTPFEPDEVAQAVHEALHEEVQDAVRKGLKDVVTSAVQGNAATAEEKPRQD